MPIPIGAAIGVLLGLLSYGSLDVLKGRAGNPVNLDEEYQLLRRDLAKLARSGKTPFTELVPGVVFGMKNQPVTIYLDDPAMQVRLSIDRHRDGHPAVKHLSVEDFRRMERIDVYRDRLAEALPSKE